MSDQRILACGDNHGDTEALEWLIDETEQDEFDFIIHTGDITNAYNTNLKTGIEQLQAIEPCFEQLAERGTLIYIYGNRDKERSFQKTARHVTDEYELDVGHRLSAGEGLTVDGQRFTANPVDAGPGDILLTHHLNRTAFYQTPAQAYFCGDTHRARQHRTALNTGYLHNDKGYDGAYFTATLGNELNISVHGIGQPWKSFICSDHEWYGQQFTPTMFGCGLCKFGPERQFRSIAITVFTDVATDNEDKSGPTADMNELVSAARNRFTDSDQFARQFRSYLTMLAENEDPSPGVPLRPAEGDQGSLRLGEVAAKQLG